MTGVREHLIDLTQIGDIEVVLGDDRVVKAVGCGTVSISEGVFASHIFDERFYMFQA
jgi:hypothetical protein